MYATHPFPSVKQPFMNLSHYLFVEYVKGASVQARFLHFVDFGSAEHGPSNPIIP